LSSPHLKRVDLFDKLLLNPGIVSKFNNAVQIVPLYTHVIVQVSFYLLIHHNSIDIKDRNQSVRSSGGKVFEHIVK